MLPKKRSGERTRTERGLACLLAAIFLFVLGGSASAGRVGQDSEGAQEALFPGPRSVFRAFFQAMEAEDLGKAIQCFEPGAFGSEAEARQAARTLYDGVFLKTRRIHVETEVPDSWAGERYRLRTGPPGEPERFGIELRRDADGNFHFARSMLERVPDWAQELEGQGLSEDVLRSMGTLDVLRHRMRATLPAVLSERSFLLENWQWLGLLALILLGVVTDRVVRFVAGRIAKRVTRDEALPISAETLLSFERPAGLFVGALVFQLLLPVLGLEAALASILTLAVSFVNAVAGVWACYRLVDVFCDYLGIRAARSASKFDDMLVPLVRRTLKLFVLVVGIVFVASHMSKDLWGVFAGLSLGSVAVGFAAKDSIENLFGTFTVLMDKPFQIGDWIIAGELEGTVEEVGFRSTRIRTFYNSLITVPNSRFIAAAVDNMGERRYRRVKTTLSLTYDTPPEKIEAFCEGVRELIRTHPYTRKDYYHVYLNGFGASSLDVLLYTFLETPDWSTELREKHRLFADILRLAEGLGVEFAFPTQTVHLAKPEDLEHPDRPADDLEGAMRGRKLAAEIADRTLQPYGGRGNVPPPVQIATRPLSGDEGEDGG